MHRYLVSVRFWAGQFPGSCRDAKRSLWADSDSGEWGSLSRAEYGNIRHALAEILRAAGVPAREVQANADPRAESSLVVTIFGPRPAESYLAALRGGCLAKGAPRVPMGRAPAPHAEGQGPRWEQSWMTYSDVRAFA